MKLALIAAVGKNGELGRNNGLIFDLPEDLQFFSKATKGHPIVMGKNTWLSLPKKLPGRKHIILSSTMKSDDPDLEVYPSLDAFKADWSGRDELVWCIGGASLYAQMLPEADWIVLTEVDQAARADVYFPSFDKSKYKRTVLQKKEENGLDYEHVVYEVKDEPAE